MAGIHSNEETSPSTEESLPTEVQGTQIEVNSSIDKLENSVQSREVCQFYLRGQCRFGEKCWFLHSDSDIKTPNLKSSQKSKKKPKEDVIVPKKPPMKTAGDVRDRILWDSDLPEEYFSVGYIDRFEGEVEKPFISFVWGNLCDAGPDDLSIPQHCISYFKYKGTKVWDKGTRLDHVFGSAGNKTKIIEKMTIIDEEIKRKMEEEEEDSDDDFNIEMGDSNQEKGILHEELLRASHFLCIKVKNPSVISGAQSVQECVYMEDPSLRDCAMPPELLHVTLSMIKCDSDEAVEELGTFLDSIVPKIKDLVSDKNSSEPQSLIEASGLSTFGARVLYAKLSVPNSFYEIVELIQKSVKSMEGVTITNNFNFVPHMTLLKIGRPKERERRSKYMNSSLYDRYLDHLFGTIDFDNIHLCAIDEFRGPDGFYRTSKKIEW